MAAGLALAMAGNMPAALHAEVEPPLIAVDIGHTVDAPGAISARGRTELAFNRDLALHVRDALEKLGLRTALVNLDGRIESLAARPAAVPDARFFLSIHHDSVSEWELRSWEYQGETHTYSDDWMGHSMFVSRRNPETELSLLCGSTIGARLQRQGFTPTEKNARRREYADPIHAVHYFDNLVVLHQSRRAALLFEAGVIKHRGEELLLRDPARQARMADAIATGVAACMYVAPLMMGH
ncbi:MAG: N-acetylmuramoyl-L-alanine amidase [Rhodocyclaceae bacterium]